MAKDAETETYDASLGPDRTVAVVCRPTGGKADPGACVDPLTPLFNERRLLLNLALRGFGTHRSSVGGYAPAEMTCLA
ncbi:hypothetical protein GCM10018780_91820 [Streptomyces lanatus]|nr:hypothetical protein GCM10018780_91820 [Streptomyces lanatus]